MQTVGIMKRKGGVGASTLTVHLAVAAAEAGRKPLILDVDEQQSCIGWNQDRTQRYEGVLPGVAAAEVRQLPGLIEKAEGMGYDLVLIDTPPHTSATTAAVARVVDLAIVPTQPSKIDLRTLSSMLHMVASTETPFTVVLNRCPYRAPEVGQARAWLDGAGVPVWAGEIGDRAVFKRSFAVGEGVTEAEPVGKSADEIRALWNYILKRL